MTKLITILALFSVGCASSSFTTPAKIPTVANNIETSKDTNNSQLNKKIVPANAYAVWVLEDATSGWRYITREDFVQYIQRKYYDAKQMVWHIVDDKNVRW